MLRKPSNRAERDGELIAQTMDLISEIRLPKRETIRVLEGRTYSQQLEKMTALKVLLVSEIQEMSDQIEHEIVVAKDNGDDTWKTLKSDLQIARRGQKPLYEQYQALVETFEFDPSADIQSMLK